MYKKILLAALIVTMSIFAFSISFAAEIDGLDSGNGPELPSPLQVYVNPGALGDALIYGYYNARNEYNFLRVINTSSGGVAVKIRFREGRHSNEVLDFFICLSGYDQWSGWIVGDSNTANPAVLYWYDDDTPTWPDPQNNNTVTDNFLATQAMHYGSTGASSIVTADDTKEGYYEVIAVSAWTDTPGSNKVVRTPKACGQILGLATELGGAGTEYPTGFTTPSLLVPANVLAGNHVIFDVASAIGTFAYNATALGDCIQAIPSPVVLATEGKPTFRDCGDGIVGVDFVLTKAREYAIYDVETSLIGSTDIINTLPTRRDSMIATWSANNGYNGPFPASCTIDGSTGEVCRSTTPGDCSSTKKLGACCVDVGTTIHDDAENTPSSTGFSPGTTPTPQKCYDVNYVTVGLTKSSLLATALLSYKLDSGSYQLGWIKEDFTTVGTYFTSYPNVPASTATAFQTQYGLPVISYELGAFVDGYWTYMLPLRYDNSMDCSSGTGALGVHVSTTCPTP